MKKLLLALVAFFAVSYGFIGSISAQGTGKIAGVVKDSTNKAIGVEFANVALLDPVTEKPVDGAMCDGTGKFSIENIKPGKYAISISFLGYETKTIRNIAVSESKSINLGNISIGQSAKLLKEVVVEGQKSLIEEKVDRTVYNAENDQTARGGDATDVLKRVPMLSVDMDGNVSLRGSQNVKVLINNKPSTISASSIADALKQIPADQIKTVEVITSPSAKYDAEGSAGIINIITKKNTMQGASLNIDGSAGLRGTNFGLNGSYRKGKMGFSMGGFGRANYNTPGAFSNTQTTTALSPGGEVLYHTTNAQSATTRNKGLFGNYTLGWDYDIDKYNSLTASAKYSVRNQHTFQDNLTTVSTTDTTGNAAFTTIKNVNTANNSGTVDASLNYTRTFDKPNKEFSVLTLFSRNNGTSYFTNSIISEPPGFVRNENKSSNQESTVQVDYQTPLSESQLLEVGGKSIMRKVYSNYQYYAAAADGVYKLDTAGNLTNTLNYSQNISAGYVSYTLNAGKGYTLKAGTRYEYTTINAHQQENKTLNIPSYGVIVPSINLAKKLGNGNVIKIAYNRRIQRPSIQYLNPNLQASNPLNTTSGNPSLRPEYTNNFELAYSTYIGGSSINLSTFARNTNNSIQAIRNVNGDTVHTTYANIGKQDAYGFSFFTGIAISNKFNLNAGTDVYYAVLKNPDPNPIYNASNSGWVTSYRLFGNYTLPKGWGLQFFGFMRGRQVLLQGYQGAFHVTSLSIKKDLLNKKGSLGFGAENFFNPTIKISNSTVSPIIDQHGYTTLHYLNFKITFSYRIGKLSFDAPKKRNNKSISNDDLKEGGDNGIQNQGVQPGAGGGAGAPAGGGRGVPGTGRPGGAGAAGYGPGTGKPGSYQKRDSLRHPIQRDSIQQNSRASDSLQQIKKQGYSINQDSLTQDFIKKDPIKRDTVPSGSRKQPSGSNTIRRDTTKTSPPRKP